MTVEQDGKLYRIDRKLNRSARSVVDKLSVTDLQNGLPLSLTVSPGEYFLGIPVEVFESSCFISQLGASSIKGEEAGTALQNLLSNADENIDTKRILKVLEASRINYLHKDAKGGSIFELEESKAKLEARYAAAVDANCNTEEFAASGSSETVIHLTVGTDEEAIRKIISRIDRTAEITVTPNTGRSGFSNAVIRFKGKKDPKEKIFNGFSAISIPITELYAETDSLENAYCKLIEEDEGSFVENPSDGSNDKGSFSLIKALFGQSVYKKDQDSSKNDQDSDDGDDSYRPLFH
jgi:hypothetical protein